MKTKKLPVFGMMLCISALITAFTASNGFSQDPNFYVFLAFGQSNMEGFATGSTTQIEKQDTTNVPDRWKLLPAIDWPNKSRVKGTWTTAKPPLCRSSTGLCPCDYFGRTLVDSLPSNVKVGIINVSLAGCCIEMFDKDKYQAYINTMAADNYLRGYAQNYGGSPYARIVEMGKLAQKDGVIKGFLLHQGESGTGVAGDNWVTEVKKIYFDLIKDLSLDSNKVPFIAGGLTADGKNNTNSSLPWNLYKPSKAFKNCYVASSIGCAANMNDGFGGLHFSAAGYRTLGKHYADTMLAVMRKLGTGPTSVSDNKIKTANNSGNKIDFKNGTLSFELPQSASVSLNLYTVSGKEVRQITNTDYSKGMHTVNFKCKDIPTGTYILKMNTGSYVTSQTIMVSAK